uniref:Late endosomal/lysosomal adaptor and MAPK and MTOR activator 5 n=1 Tax=Macrostomum lignano TaxID=282301 RepID=A0A1I8J5E5_9PLAT
MNMTRCTAMSNGSNKNVLAVVRDGTILTTRFSPQCAATLVGAGGGNGGIVVGGVVGSDGGGGVGSNISLINGISLAFIGPIVNTSRRRMVVIRDVVDGTIASMPIYKMSTARATNETL